MRSRRQRRYEKNVWEASFMVSRYWKFVQNNKRTYVYCCILIYRLAQNVNNEYNRPTWEAYTLDKSNYTLCRTHPSLLCVNHVCIVDLCKTGLVPVDMYTCDFSNSLWSRVPPILLFCYNVMQIAWNFCERWHHYFHSK